MDSSGGVERGFGTTAEEWKQLRLAYSIALLVSDGVSPDEITLARFRAMDETASLAFESWWSTRPKF